MYNIDLVLSIDCKKLWFSRDRSPCILYILYIVYRYIVSTIIETIDYNHYKIATLVGILIYVIE